MVLSPWKIRILRNLYSGTVSRCGSRRNRLIKKQNKIDKQKIRLEYDFCRQSERKYPFRTGGSFATVWKWYPKLPHQIPDPGNSTAYPLPLFFSVPDRDCPVSYTHLDVYKRQAQTGEKILHFQRKKPNPAQIEVKILHYEEEKSGFAQFQGKKF